MNAAPEGREIVGESTGEPGSESIDSEFVEIQQSDSLSCEYPSDDLLVQWAEAALESSGTGVDAGNCASLTIRVVDTDEINACNKQWRGKDKATNVLSFPAEFPPEAGVSYLGDIMVCADILMRESEEQDKTLNDHWAHIVVHGVSHLRGFDHENTQDAEIMEKREKEILATLGVADPYRYEINS